MKTDAATLERFAELLKVDEVRTFDLIRPAYGFMLRIGVLWQKVEIDEADLYYVSLDKRIKHIVRILFESARNLRWRVEQEQSSVFTRNLIGEAERQSAWLTPITPNEVEFIPLQMDDVNLGMKKYIDYIDYIQNTVTSMLAVPADLLGVGIEQTGTQKLAAILSAEGQRTYDELRQQYSSDTSSDAPKPPGRFEMICLELEDL